MLQNDFFELTSFQPESEAIKATIILNKDHQIYKGHFPAQAIVPGVCFVQILKEILEFTLSQKLFLIEAKQIKFLKMIHPEENPILNAEINWSIKEDIYIVNASFSVKDEISFKFNGQLKTFL